MHDTSESTIFEMAASGNFLDGGSIWLFFGEAKHGGTEFCQTGSVRQRAPIIMKVPCQ